MVRSWWRGTVAAAAFQTRTSDELVTISYLGGRATFQNVGDTRRNGLELSLRRDLFERRLTAEPQRAGTRQGFLDRRCAFGRSSGGLRIGNGLL